MEELGVFTRALVPAPFSYTRFLIGVTSRQWTAAGRGGMLARAGGRHGRHASGTYEASWKEAMKWLASSQACD